MYGPSLLTAIAQDDDNDLIFVHNAGTTGKRTGVISAFSAGNSTTLNPVDLELVSESFGYCPDAQNMVTVGDTLYVGGSGKICAFNISKESFGEELPAIGEAELLGRLVSSLAVGEGILLAANDGMDDESLELDNTEFLAAVDLTTEEPTVVVFDHFGSSTGIYPSDITTTCDVSDDCNTDSDLFNSRRRRSLLQSTTSGSTAAGNNAGHLEFAASPRSPHVATLSILEWTIKFTHAVKVHCLPRCLHIRPQGPPRTTSVVRYFHSPHLGYLPQTANLS